MIPQTYNQKLQKMDYGFINHVKPKNHPFLYLALLAMLIVMISMLT